MNVIEHSRKIYASGALVGFERESRQVEKFPLNDAQLGRLVELANEMWASAERLPSYPATDTSSHLVLIDRGVRREEKFFGGMPGGKAKELDDYLRAIIKKTSKNAV